MPGHLALKQLDQLIRKGEVDTVLTVFPDGFGRLMGKRVVGSYFLDHVVDEGAHACIYLFTVDMEMEALTPVAGYLEDYHILQTTKEEPLIRAIRNGMEGADVPVETSKGEWGRGQEEINLRYADALEMADRTALYKHGAKEIAHLMGAAVTFMAKYDMGAAGSSFHLHSSLWDKTGRKALFATGVGARTP